jgi:hypothetical protein
MGSNDDDLERVSALYATANDSLELLQRHDPRIFGVVMIGVMDGGMVIPHAGLNRRRIVEIFRQAADQIEKHERSQHGH